MGLIRGIAFTVVAVLLFVSLLSMNTFWSISRSLEYDVIKTEFVPVITDMILEQTDFTENLDSNLEGFSIYCANNSNFVFSQQEVSYEIPCDALLEGSEVVLSHIVSTLIETNYYKEYDCSFWQCPMDPPYHLISQKAQDYWSEWFYLFLVISIVLIAISVLLIQNKNDYPIILGGLLIVSSLLFAKMDWILSLMNGWEFIDIVKLFFTEAYTVFLIELVAGIILILIGIALKFLGLGQWVLNLFSLKKKE